MMEDGEPGLDGTVDPRHLLYAELGYNMKKDNGAGMILLVMGFNFIIVIGKNGRHRQAPNLLGIGDHGKVQ